MRFSILAPVVTLLATSFLPGCDTTSNGKATGGDVAATGRAKGTADAKAALAKGTLLLKEYPPLPSPAEHGEYIKLLKEKCGCAYEVVSAPEFSEALRDEVQGWNEVMMPEIRSKFGATIFEDLQAEARKRWEARTKEKK